MTMSKYIVQACLPNGVQYANTIEDLQRYLYSDPFPDYRLVAVDFRHSGSISLVWELKENAKKAVAVRPK